VIYGRQQGIHVSGHGAREDHKLMLNLTRPKFFIPVHGEHRMLVEHSGMAQAMGIPKENIVIIKNGNIIELTENSIGVTGEVPAGIELVDRAGIVQDNVMKERQQLAEDGVITVAAAINWSGQLVASPALHLRGVVTSIEQSLLQQLVNRTIERILSDRWEDFSETKDGETEVDWTGVRLEIEGGLQRLLKRELKSRPLVVFMMQMPEKQPEKNKTARRRKRSSSISTTSSSSSTPAPVISSRK
ncbi:MAG: MBL fold metallo-hydrolase RNA specificity domain-containing protein, partial [Waterburya sp.]